MIFRSADDKTVISENALNDAGRFVSEHMERLLPLLVRKGVSFQICLTPAQRNAIPRHMVRLLEQHAVPPDEKYKDMAMDDELLSAYSRYKKDFFWKTRTTEAYIYDFHSKRSVRVETIIEEDAEGVTRTKSTYFLDKGDLPEIILLNAGKREDEDWVVGAGW